MDFKKKDCDRIIDVIDINNELKDIDSIISLIEDRYKIDLKSYFNKDIDLNKMEFDQYVYQYNYNLLNQDEIDINDIINRTINLIQYYLLFEYNFEFNYSINFF